jgi:DNA-binding LytR/AlgR family response regulator
MMRCLIVDDEQLVRELLEDNIRQIPYLQLVKSCRHAMEATDILQTEQIDCIFLDIRMPRLNGLQFLESLTDPPLIILVTAYEKYALDGFSLNVVDYLLKPFSFERFLKACNRANDLFRLRQTGKTIAGIAPATDIPPVAPDFFFVSVEYTQVKIMTADITHIEGLNDYIKIYLSSTPKPVLTRMTLRAIEEKLPAPAFIRIHKSYLVAAQKITRIKRDLVCIGEKELPISKSYKDNVTRIL